MSNKKTFRKYAVSTMAAATAASAIVPAAVSADTQTSFPDVSDNNSHKDAIYQLVEEGVIQGHEDGTFRPYEDVTRSQVAVMLFEKLGLSEPSDLSEALSNYKDVGADHRYAKQIAAVSEAGVFYGNDQGQFQPYTDISRQQMATALVQGFGLEKYDVGEDVDIDLSKVSSDHKKNVQILANLGITNQLGDEVDNNFEGYDSVSRAQFSSFLVLASEVTAAKIVDLENPADVTVDKGTAAEDVELPETVKATYDNDTTGDVAVEWDLSELDTNKVGTYEVVGSVEGTDLTVTAEVVVRAVDVVVEDVSAVNAEEILVTFSDDVTKESAEDDGHYEIFKNGSDDTDKVEIADIKVDGNQALLLLGESAKEGDRYVVQTNNGIVSVDGKPVEKFAAEQYVYENGAAPSLKGVTAAGENLVLTFDRPVSENVELVKVDGIALEANELTLQGDKKAGNYTYEVALGNQAENAVKEGNHEVVIFDVKDTAAENKVNNSVINASYTITADKTAPEVKSIEELNANKFFIETNRYVDVDMEGLKVVKGNHEFEIGTTLNTDSSSVFAEPGYHNGKPGVVVVVTDDYDGNDSNPLYKKDESTVNLDVTFENYKATGTNLIGKKYTGQVTLDKDSTKPTVKTTTLKDGNFEVTFNDNLTGAPTSGIVVRDKDGVIKNASVELKTDDNTTLEITPDDYKKENAPYSVEFKADTLQYKETLNSVENYVVASLKNDKIETTVDAESDPNFKYVKFVGTVEPTANVNGGITVTYDKEMTKSAVDVNNYKLDGKELPEGTEINFVNDTKTVEIVLPEGTVKTTTDYKLSISSDVTTTDNEHIVGDLQTKSDAEPIVKDLVDNTKPELSSAVYALASDDADSTNQILVTFNEAVDSSSLNEHDFDVEINGSKQTVTDAAPGSEDGEVLITLGKTVSAEQSATVTVIPGNDGKVVIADTAGNTAEDGSSVTATKSKVVEGGSGNEDGEGN